MNTGALGGNCVAVLFLILIPGIVYLKENWMKAKSTRAFGGLLTLNDIKETLKEKFPNIPEKEMELRVRLESLFQKKHLKAYLRGQDRFQYGHDNAGRPLFFEVEDGRVPKKNYNEEIEKKED